MSALDVRPLSLLADTSLTSSESEVVHISISTWPARSLPYCRDDINLEGGVAVVCSETLFSVPALSSTHLQKLNGEDYFQH